MMRAIAILFLALLSSCGPNSGNVHVQVVAALDEKMSRFGLKVVELPRLLDVTALRGERFIFVAATNTPWNVYSDTCECEDSFESSRATLFEKVPLQPVNLSLSWNGSFYKASDFDSLYMLTAYYLFEQVADFFVDEVKDRSKATTTPVYVNVYGSLTSKGLIKVPSGFVDNSAYLPLEDMFKMYRVADQEGLPFEMNPGVVAHEFQHRVFHDHVFQSPGKDGFKVWKKFSSTEASLKYARARVLLRATDEGLSDIYAVGFTRNTHFLSVSRINSEAKIAENQRDLEGPFAQAATYDNLADSSLDAKFIPMCHGESVNFSNSNWRYYCLATVIARTLWVGSDKDMNVLRGEMLPAVNRALKDVSDEVMAQFEKYDIDVLWRALLKNLREERQQILCAEIKVRFASLYPRISQCS